jgi:hypothetical protein
VAEPEADLTGFLEAAGRSLADAQGTLTGDLVDLPTAVAISEAELEVKATVDRSSAGVVLQPVSTAAVLKGGITPGVLSTLKIRYVAVAEDTVAPPSQRPSRDAGSVIGEVQKREDVVALDQILGGLRFEAVFVPARQRWLVTARDPEDRLVREVVVPDA